MAGSTAGASMVKHAEPPEQPGVALLHLAGAVERGRREKPDLPARQEGLEQIPDAAPGSALPEEGVDPADVEDHVFRALARRGHRGEDLAKALFDLAAKLRTRHEKPGLELEDAELREALGHVARGDAHRERPDDRGLANARLADQKGVVLLPPLEDLEEAADLHVAPDDRVEAAAPRALDEVVGEARQDVSSAGRGRGDHFAWDALQRRHVRPEAARAEAERLHDDRRRTADLLRERVEQVLDVDGARSGLLLGARQELEHRAREIREAGRRLVDPPERRLRFDRHVGGIAAGLAKDLLHAAVAIDRAREQVNGLDLRVLSLVGKALGPCDERFRVRRVAVEVNRLLSGHAPPIY